MPANKLKQQLGEFQPTELDDLSEYASAGHYEVPSQLLADPLTGVFGVRASHGLYRIGIDPQGRQVCLFSEDPDALTPVAHRNDNFRRNVAPGYYLDPAHMERIHVVGAREERTIRRWILPAIDEHNNDMASTLLEQGYLYKLSDVLWASGSIAYKLTPASPRAVKRIRKLMGREGEGLEDDLYVLRCYTTGGKDADFVDLDDHFLRTRMGRLLGRLSRVAIVTKNEAERIIADDFVRRVDLVMRGRDPDLLGRDPKDPAMRSALSPQAGGIVSRTGRILVNLAARTLQSAYMQYSRIDGRTVTVRLVKAAGLTTLQLLTKGIFAAAGQILGEILQPILKELGGKDRKDRRTRDIAEKFWSPASAGTYRKKHYGRLDPDKGRTIRLMEAGELNIKATPRRDIQTDLPADWPEEQIAGLLGAPPGSIIERRRVSNMDVAYVSEPNGLDICYLIGRNIAYAISNPANVHELAAPLRRRRQLMEGKGGIVKVWVAADGTLQSTGLTADGLVADIAQETDVPDDFTPMAPLKHDLRLLAEFQKRAGMDEAATRSFLGNAFRKAKDWTGLFRPANDNERGEERRALDALLRDRGADAAAHRQSPRHG